MRKVAASAAGTALAHLEEQGAREANDRVRGQKGARNPQTTSFGSFLKDADTEGDREQTVQKEQRIDERAAFSSAGQPS